MNELEKHIKGLNPTNKEILIYGAEYKLFRTGEYIGSAIWVKDVNVGDSFQTNNNGLITVYNADSWELIIK